jgi:hypothetical protein
MTKQQLIEELTKKYGYKEKDLDKKSKKDLEETLETEYNKLAEGVFEDLEVETAGVGDGQLDPVAISKASPDWSKVIMKEFTDDEKEGNSPKIIGLRRLANKFYPGWSTRVEVIQVPTKDNGYRSAVKVSITATVGDFNEVTHEDVAECTYHNTEGVYRDYPLATAQTRAEGRALKKLLGLNISTFEETGLVGGASDKASDTMINSVRSLADKKNIDLDKMVAENFPELEGAELMTKGQVQQIVQIIKGN